VDDRAPDERDDASAAATEAEPVFVAVVADEMAKAEEAAADADDRLRRTMADLENLRKRFDREVARERADERARVAREWLEVVDNLERATEHGAGEQGPLVDGLRAVLAQAHLVLARLGFPRFDPVGEPFDPMRHEAIGVIPADAPAGTVVGTVQPGYGTADTILRPASVVVSRGGD
jgi:molecular chaperone GrpE